MYICLDDPAEISETKIIYWSEDTMQEQKSHLRCTDSEISKPKKCSQNAQNNRSSNGLNTTLENSPQLENNSVLMTETVIPSSEKKSYHKLLKEFNSVGHIMNRISQDSSSENVLSPEINVTKRRRTRTRKRTRKSKTDVTDLQEQTFEKSYTPPKCIAAPKMHKRFSDNEENVSGFDSPEKTLNTTILSHSTPYIVNTKRLPEMSIIPEEFNADILKKMAADSTKILTDPPNIKDKIIFKVKYINIFF